MHAHATPQEDPVTDTLNLAVIAGDGIGPEVVAEGLKVLDARSRRRAV